MQLNPDVTARGAGVMEKCTFCIQRIVSTEINAKIEKREVRDGEIITACAQACPTKAISFGDMKDPNSEMMKRREANKNRTYRSLEELNTQPAIVYLRNVYLRTGEILVAAAVEPLNTTPISPTSIAACIASWSRRACMFWAWIGFCAMLVAIAAALWTRQIYEGLGVTGLKQPTMWAVYITNFVFWVGIAHSGTLISAILYLFRTRWRTAVYRLAETMTLSRC